MTTNPTVSAKPGDVPTQFTLRQVAVWIVWISVALALLSQIGTWWGLALWIIAGVAVLAYGVYRSSLGWIAAGLVTVGVLVFGFVLLPAVTIPRWATRRSQCQHNLKQIGIALHNYHDTYGSFPPAYIADKQGRPMHSWRVLILPFLDHDSLYKRYDLNEPWDGPNNSKLASQMPRIYGCPSDSPSFTDTSYVVVVGDGTIWKGAKPVSCADITDGTSNTILVVESHGAGINWMEPRDLHALQMPPTVNPVNGQGICSCHNSKTNDRGRGDCAVVVIADGSVRMLQNDTPPKTIDELLTIAGGEPTP